MATWSEVLDARTNERRDLFARIRPEYVGKIEWDAYDEEVQYEIVGYMLQPYGFEAAAAWHHWTFVLDGGKYHIKHYELLQLMEGQWIAVDRVEMAQWEKEYYRENGGLYSGAYTGRSDAIAAMNLQPMNFHSSFSLKDWSREMSRLELELTNRELELVVEMSMAYDNLINHPDVRRDYRGQWKLLLHDFTDYLEEWLDEIDEDDIDDIEAFVWEKFKDLGWRKPDFKDRETIKAIVQDAGYAMSRKQIDRILDHRVDAWITISTPEDYLESEKETLGGEYTEEDLLAGFGVDGVQSMEEASQGLEDGIFGHNIPTEGYNGVYHGEPYVLEVIEF